eukprot:12728100-Heterocapsa_arctica.AAC.1
MAVADDAQTLQSILPRDEVALVSEASEGAEEPPGRDQSGLASLSGAHFAFGAGEGLPFSTDSGVSVSGTQ